MRKSIFRHAMVFFTFAVSAICVAGYLLFVITIGSKEFTEAGSIAAFSLAEKKLLAMRKEIARMNVEEKIGQMLMVSIPGKEVARETAEWLASHHVGGIILLGKNVESAEQVKIFIKKLQEEGRDLKDPPLFIAVDQEGGEVSRFRFLKELTPQYGIIADDQAFRVAFVRAQELRALGVNINFSPVVDVALPGDFIYSRAFRGSSHRVAMLGNAMMRGYHEGGIIGVVKHFPGHGGTSIDSHRLLPVLSLDDEARERALFPFRQAMGEVAEMLMVGHVLIPQMDIRFPASLSDKITGKVLREELGYRGVVITDDLGMGAILRSYTLSDAAIRAFHAGADILLMVRGIEEYEKVFVSFKAAVEKKEISEERLDESVRRILLLKSHLTPNP